MNHQNQSLEGSIDPVTTNLLVQWLGSEVAVSAEKHAEEILVRSASIFAGDQGMLIWEDADEPWLFFTTLKEGAIESHQEIYSQYTPVISGELSRHPFVQTSQGEIHFLTGGQIELFEGESPYHPNVVAGRDLSNSVTIPIDSSLLTGHLIVCPVVAIVETDVLPMAGLISAIAASRLNLVDQISEASNRAVDNRLNEVARDLHDGLLQSFTGVVLQLETVHQFIDESPDQAKALITQLQSVLMGEQRDLRSYLERIRPKMVRAEAEFNLAERFDELTRRYANEWGIELTFDRSNVNQVVLDAIGWETYRILAEAINNAARHGAARVIRVVLITEEDWLSIFIHDDGDGFDFRGRFGIAELEAKGVGPSSMMERVAGLNGELFVESTDSGSTIEVRLPIGWGG